MLLSLQVKLIAPAMLGGAEPRECDDPATLRPPSLRGALRFWTRALAAGAGLDIRYQESALWGNTDTGRLISVLPSRPLQPIVLPLLPHHRNNMPPQSRNPVELQMLPPGETLDLRFSLPAGVDINKFRAVLWTWLHLGTVGRRSRRGYGSLLWMPLPDDALNSFITFNHQADLASRTALEDYLRHGLAQVHSVCGAPQATIARRPASFFTLETMDQVFVGQILRNSEGPLTRFDQATDGLQKKIHGMKRNVRNEAIASSAKIASSAEADEMGYFDQHSKQRLGSAMIWRLFPCGNAFIPVMTWSPHATNRLTSGTKMHDYLTNILGFSTSLAGNPL